MIKLLKHLRMWGHFANRDYKTNIIRHLIGNAIEKGICLNKSKTNSPKAKNLANAPLPEESRINNLGK